MDAREPIHDVRNQPAANGDGIVKDVRTFTHQGQKPTDDSLARLRRLQLLRLRNSVHRFMMMSQSSTSGVRKILLTFL